MTKTLALATFTMLAASPLWAGGPPECAYRAPVECRNANSTNADLSILPTEPGTHGPLRRESGVPFFVDAYDQGVYLTGSHTWNNLQDWGDCRSDPAQEGQPFPYDTYLDMLVSCGHNFIRLWAFEGPSVSENDDILPANINPLPWVRDDARKKGTEGLFDLDDVPVKINEAYLSRLEDRVAAAKGKGIYVGVMLFQGWSIQRRALDIQPWPSHPFNGDNNNNDIDGDLNDDGQGTEVHTLAKGTEDLRVLQDAYVAAVVDRLKDYDNVLWEITNESLPSSNAWQNAMVTRIRNLEANNTIQHPIGRTSYGTSFSNADLFASGADWISPTRRATEGQDYASDPPANDGSQVVVISDTDHVGEILGQNADVHRPWIWKNLTRGLQSIFMDPVTNGFSDDFFAGTNPANPEWPKIRAQLGRASRFANKLDLVRAAPLDAAQCSAYCLGVAHQGQAHEHYLIYSPSDDDNPIQIRLDPGMYDGEWLDPEDGSMMTETFDSTGSAQTVTKPYDEAVLYLKRRPPSVKLVGHYVPRFGFDSTTSESETTNPESFDFFFDPNRGTYEERPSGPCDNQAENPTYLKVSIDTSQPINACSYFAKWDSQPRACTQEEVDLLNQGGMLVLNTDDIKTASTGTCDDLPGEQAHVSYSVSQYFAMDLEIDGTTFSRRLNFRPRAQVLRIHPTDDVHVWEQTPDLNYGTEWLLEVRGAPAKIKHAFLKFTNLNGPNGAVLVSSQLRLSVTEGSTASLEVRKLCGTGAWTATGAQWNNWLTQTGGLCDVITTLPAPGIGDRLRIDVSGSVQQAGTALWQVGLAAGGPSTGDLVFLSNDSGDPKLPTLVLVFQAPEP